MGNSLIRLFPAKSKNRSYQIISRFSIHFHTICSIGWIFLHFTTLLLKCLISASLENPERSPKMA
ncbi:hypothetical protein CH380_00225 [Leptospira adleri]|uniref:Uncharacterized protein n=1 Tax=Leptospira adleri TaxID=2023186 RepID=A0A2M9YTW8_9LEPT|nr:hypothetical protein CH380_00225 [Leptospira adleri]PJZ60924.1 hypothetical protein CH376_15880 [Leptospira adleri]